MDSKKITLRELCRAGIFTAVIFICAQISIPMPYGVPMTLQTLAIPLAGVLLGQKNGTLSVISYIMLGACGVPVFAGFAGGLGAVFGPTGGFILSFPVMAALAGAGAKRNNKFWLVCGILAGTVINYLCGMYFFSFITACDIKTAFAACVLPFIPTAIIKIAIAAVFGGMIKNKIVI